MELHRIRGGALSDLEGKRYNIGIGASLGNKWFTVENTIDLIRWSLVHTKEFVIVYIADTIHAINLEVRNRVSSERAVRLAQRKGTEWIDSVKAKVHEQFDPASQARIFYARWNDLQDTSFMKKRDFLYAQYESDLDFKDRIESIVRGFIVQESRLFTESDIHRLGTYILEELPEMICRVPIAGRVYEANAYPFDSGITELAENIQLGKAFPDIKKAILDTEPKVFLEVR